MKKIKIISVLVAALLVSLAGSCIGGAFPAKDSIATADNEEPPLPPVVLNGTIDVKINGLIGVVAPTLNFTDENEGLNQTIHVYVNATEDPLDPDNNTYFVDDTLMIKLDITDKSRRDNFLLPRSLIYGYILARDPKEVRPIFPIFRGEDSFFKRLFPEKKLLTSAQVVNATLFSKGKVDSINISMTYKITNEIYNESNGFENMTLHIFAMGFIPWDINGISEEGVGRIVDHVKINLEIHYDRPLG